jgi:hypothetical protein
MGLRCQPAELPLHCSDAGEVVCDLVVAAALASEQVKPTLKALAEPAPQR